MTNNQIYLSELARKLVEKPKGILAIDESLKTIETRFRDVGLENTEENRRAYREMLITTQGLGDYISGAILFEETIYQETHDGRSFVSVLNSQKIIPGIKVDQGTEDFEVGIELKSSFRTPKEYEKYVGCGGEKLTVGLDGLPERLKKYRQQGVQFTKWRAVFYIGFGRPSGDCMNENVRRLADYAAMSQAEGLVPIVEPEVLSDGHHDIKTCCYVTSEVLDKVFSRLDRNWVNLEGLVLKPNMVVPGKYHSPEDPSKVAYYTAGALRKCVPNKVPGIAFLSGGLSDEDATTYLNEMNLRYASELPWNLTFSFGRALQREALKAFAEKSPDNVKRAQEKLLKRAKETSLATEGLLSDDYSVWIGGTV